MGFKLQRFILPASRATVVAALTEIIITGDPTNAFIPSDDGQFICQLIGDASPVTIQVVQGAIYPLNISEIPANNTRAGILLYPV